MNLLRRVSTVLMYLADVSSNLTSLLIEGISLHAVLLDSHVALIAAFVTTIFKIIGQDFGMPPVTTTLAIC
jgi:hypothetical protein